MFGLHFGSEFPDEGDEFAGDSDFGFVVVQAAFAEGFVAFVEPQLGLPGEGFYPLILVCLSFS